ncbi:hypothetical protein GW933_01345 [Candidatus Falkowbacteria bacterium]|uniref:DUF5050 domain-containing protein n=1 Tax=Candidatus Buchananbacteria bacterium CG10_big_fil_rev_8_21_14_0_10_33_19 TaxID=1974525 RepID=A0A2H0W3G7_9BACT|nr:hypothetical protein [Candidatus Falkowbacteria bacterium]PIS05899.1 MAG: hypothetical protein COT80_03975 [Candidatus Buchananbacteria bacterium CG10_big_fil_rev_8_21_14_0_10_33_19]
MKKVLSIFSFKLFLIIALFFFLVFIYAKLGFNHWPLVEAIDRPVLESGWSQPVSVGINTASWESGAYISSDGNTIYYSFYPGNLVKDRADGKIKTDLNIYYSEKPFNKSKVHTLSEAKWFENGVMVVGSDFYYASDRNHLGINDIYKNGSLIINTPNQSEKDPHYCATRDELYFDVGGVIYYLTDNQTVALTAAVNNGGQNIQPFLTKDCEQLYFVSNRGDGIHKILRSSRLSNNLWGEPELVVSSKYGVESPSLTDDNKTLFFVQILKSAKDELNADILYVIREE